MPTITDIRSQGTTITVAPRPIFEPLSAPEKLNEKLGRFGDHYNTNNDSNLYKYLLAVCGEAGAGSIKKQLLYPKLQSLLESTHFTDLDRLYGLPLGLPRMSEEIYTVDPRNEALTEDQWRLVYIKDSQYRARCLTWMRAIIAGSTPDGIRLAAEAASGVECTIVERYKFIENALSDNPTTMLDVGLTQSRQEFVILPQTLSLTEADRRRIARLIDLLRPTNTIATVKLGTVLRTEQTIQNVAASTESFKVLRLVTGRGDINWPPTDPAQGLWITNTEQEAPTFAFMQKEEAITFLTIIDVEASSEHIGDFNRTQKELFSNLNINIDPLHEFFASNSYVRTFAPVQLSIPWTASY